MRAMVGTAFGGPEVLGEREIPDPTPGEHDLLIEVRASALNPVDLKIRSGELRFGRKAPFVLGHDCSGVVRAVGAAVRGFRPGDEVFASASLGRDGANAEFVCVDSRSAAFKPHGIGHLEAAVLPLAGITAWEALFERARLTAGETLLVHGGAGGVGHLAVQLGQHAGARVIATARRPESLKCCAALGVDLAIDASREDFRERVREATRGRGCDVVLDTVGGEVFERSLDSLALNGRLVALLPASSPRLGEALFGKNASVHFEFMGVPTLYGVRPESQGRILRHVARLVESDALEPIVSQSFALRELALAHRALESGRTIGKLGILVRE